MLEPRPFALALVLTAAACAAASADTLRCRSVNGNTTCSGSGAVSCQTVNGRTVCVGGHGAAVQSFGGTPTPEEMQGALPDRDGSPDAWGSKGDPGDDVPPRRAPPRLSIDRRDANGPALSLERSEGRLRLRTRSAAIAIDR